jgi:hypothetical protein
MSIKLRLKLSDFIGTWLEDDIMHRIQELHSSVPVAFEVVFWYNDGELAPSLIGSFLKVWESALRNKTYVVPSKEVSFADSVFFNIVREKHRNDKLNYGFEYVYSGHARGILDGLDKFEHAATFCYTPKNSIRKQKRNDDA